MINKNELQITKLVTKVINLAEEELKYSNDAFNVAYGVDKNFLFGAGVSITSILMHNKNMDFHFHVFTDFFDAEQKILFSQLAKQYDTKITIYLLECEELKKLPTTKSWSYATYFRFIIVDYLSSNINKLLYLDADIFCKGNIIELTQITLKSNKIGAGVQEGGKAKFTSIDANSKGEKYFNAGFLLINTQQWQEENISQQAIKLLLEKKYPFLDQDVLNLLLIDKVIFLEEKWNTIYSLDDEIKGNIKRKIRENSILIHYIGHTKPWHKWANPALIKPFIIAKNASPWKDIPLESATSSHLLKYQFKHALCQKNYLSAFSAYIKYLWKCMTC